MIVVALIFGAFSIFSTVANLKKMKDKKFRTLINYIRLLLLLLTTIGCFVLFSNLKGKSENEVQNVKTLLSFTECADDGQSFTSEEVYQKHLSGLGYASNGIILSIIMGVLFCVISALTVIFGGKKTQTQAEYYAVN